MQPASGSRAIQTGFSVLLCSVLYHRRRLIAYRYRILALSSFNGSVTVHVDLSHLICCVYLDSSEWSSVDLTAAAVRCHLWLLIPAAVLY